MKKNLSMFLLSGTLIFSSSICIFANNNKDLERDNDGKIIISSIIDDASKIGITVTAGMVTEDGKSVGGFIKEDGTPIVIPKNVIASYFDPETQKNSSLYLVEGGVNVTIPDGAVISYVTDVTPEEFNATDEFTSNFSNDLTKGTSAPTNTWDLASTETASPSYKTLYYGNYKYKNHNGTIKVNVTNESTTVDQEFNVKLYNSSGTLIGTQTLKIDHKVIGIFNNKTATFANLSTGTEYYYTLSQSSPDEYVQTVKTSR